MIMNSKDKMLSLAMKPALGMIQGMMKEVTPENILSQWIEKNLPLVIGCGEQGEEEDDTGFGVITTLFVAETNKNPVETLKRLVRFHNSFGEFYKSSVEDLRLLNHDKQ